MKIVHFNTQETGGAAAAAMRLNQSLVDLGHESSLCILEKESGQTRMQKASGLVRPVLDRALVKILAPRCDALFSAALTPNGALRRTVADVIHLHWIGSGFLDIAALRGVRRPIVWTLHDMWPFTGGCFYDAGCGRFIGACGCCPALRSARENDLSRRVFRRKEKAWNGVDLTLVAPSRWMAEEARRSALFRNRRIEVIPNCLDTALFKPVGKARAREILNLPQDRPLALFGAVNPRTEPRKGYDLLVKALPELEKLSPRPEFLLFGEGSRGRREEGGSVWHSLGRLRDEVSLALAYNAADVFVAPSLQENLPNTVLEALSCGTPCVAFAIGGMPDLIVHQENGFLAEPFDAQALARGIAWVLSANGEALGRRGRAGVLEKHLPAEIGARHALLYADLTR